jgi:cytochrome oxidase Cu insertion factor (SCO1/SenC/PrrC family)
VLIRARALGVARTASVLVALLVVITPVSGCGSGGNANPAAGTVQFVTGNTMNQKVPEAAAASGLVDQDGRSLSLGSLRGKIVVLAPLLCANHSNEGTTRSAPSTAAAWA